MFVCVVILIQQFEFSVAVGFKLIFEIFGLATVTYRCGFTFPVDSNL